MNYLQFSSDQKNLWPSIRQKIESLVSKKRNHTLKVLISGGITPYRLYQNISNSKSLVLKNAIYFQTDERIIDITSSLSDQSKAESAFSGMLIKNQNWFPFPVEKLISNSDYVDLKEKYFDRLEKIDLCILGIGNDGHFASVFPHQSIPDTFCYRTLAPDYLEVKNRITLNPQIIFKSKCIVSILEAPRKLNVMSDIFNPKLSENDFPVKRFLKHDNFNVIMIT